MTVNLQDGVYIGLSDEHYFAQDRLGSTDLVRLSRTPADWWYGTRHNPDREPPTKSEERDFGKALHILLLEGEEAYRDRCVPCPYENFTSKDARRWRDDQLVAGLTILTEDMDRRVRHMAALLANHPEFDEAFDLASGASEKGGGLSEVVILFTLQDTAVRAKIDRLLPAFLIDLKSYGGHVRGRDPKDKALRIVAERDFDVQRYLYDRAREALVGLVKSGKVFGANDRQRAWLERVAQEQDWSWVWMFFQRRDNSHSNPRAPVVQPIRRHRFDVTFETGRRKTETAIQNYHLYAERFGLGSPWALIERLWTPKDHEFPPWLTDGADPQSDHEEIAA